MRIRFFSLKLICRLKEEIVDLSAHVSFFHGQLSAGKSTVARLIDFCIGGDLEITTAIQREFIAAQLSLAIGEHEVLLERNKGENQIQVSWGTKGRQPSSVLVKAKGDGPEVLPGVRNLSDLVLHLLGIPVIKVRTRTEDPESPMARLSLRDILKFCYLPQEELDSAFFHLLTPIRREKSKDVLNYVLGFFSDSLSALQIEYDQVATEQRTKELSAKRITEFLAQFKFGTESDINLELAEISQQAADLETLLRGDATNFQTATHFADEQRAELRDISFKLTSAEETLVDLQRRAEEQKELRAELISMKFKTARADRARTVLAGAKFQSCPNCGEPVSPQRTKDTENCYLCLQPPSPAHEHAPSGDVVRADLDSRIAEVDSFLRRQERALGKQNSIINDLRQSKSRLDAALSKLLVNYETDRLTRTRDAERRLATLQERHRFLEQLRQLPDAVNRMAEEADALKAKLEGISRKIDQEMQRLAKADQNFTLLEQYFLEALVAIGLPGVSPNDTVRVSRKTLIVEILPAGDETSSYTFFTAGSGGRKVLITICFALALHRVAAVRSLPLPTFVMIDSPTKNITPDINPKLVAAFYSYLYQLAETDLRTTQIILIDQSLVKPPKKSQLSFSERLMQRGDPEHPPLISYYDGP